MKDIFFNEWKGLYRNRLFILLISLFIAVLITVTWLGVIQNNKQKEAQENAHKHIREQWDDMKPVNPHSAAHYGSYAFKPSTVLNSIDEGINSVTGNILRLEGHKQNDIVHSEASQSLLISKFGKLKPSLLFQFIIPLFLIFLVFNSYTRERESGRLKLLLIQGAKLKQIVFGKIVSIWLIGVLLLLLTTLIQLLVGTSEINSDVLSRLGLFVLSYSLYYFIVTALTVLLSVIFKDTTASLSFTISIWVVWTIFLPKITGNVVEKISPLPTRVEFKKAMADDRSQGIDGHNPSDEREEKLEKEILAKYKVDSISQLPINFDGIVMQADEEFGNSVWDKHFGELFKQMQSQKRNYQLSGVINPFASLQNLSMGATGTDMYHHLDFLKKAEDYRRVFIKTLNDEHAYGGSKTGDWGWKPDQEFFKSVKDFEYKSATIKDFGANYLIDILLLFAWSIILIFLVFYSSKRVSIL